MQSNNAQTRPLNVMVVSDSKPGHFNQSLGLAEALQKHHSINLTTVAPLTHTEALTHLTLKQQPRAWAQASLPDLVIGTGSGTHLSLIAAKRIYDCYTVVLCSSSFPAFCFDLCIHPEHDAKKFGDNIITTKGVINKVKPSNGNSPQQGLILIGGESKHYHWDSQVIVNQIKEVIQQQPAIKWHISNSRRTPDDLFSRLAPQTNNVQLFHWEDTPQDWLPSEIAQAGAIWVTPDSVSMVYESLTSGNPVYLFKLKNKKTRVSKAIDRLKGKEAGELKSGRIIPPSIQSPLWEADRIAQLILQRLNP